MALVYTSCKFCECARSAHCCIVKLKALASSCIPLFRYCMQRRIINAILHWVTAGIRCSSIDTLWAYYYSIVLHASNGIMHLMVLHGMGCECCLASQISLILSVNTIIYCLKYYVRRSFVSLPQAPLFYRLMMIIYQISFYNKLDRLLNWS